MPGFKLSAELQRLPQEGIQSSVSLGIGLGGFEDAGLDLPPEGRELAEKIARDSSAALGARLLGAAGIGGSVEERLALYKEAAKGRSISLYVNIGGAQASMGVGSAAVKVRF